MSKRYQDLYETIVGLSPSRIKSTYEAGDLINDVFLDYLQAHPQYVKGKEKLNIDEVKKFIYWRRFKADRPSYPVHSTANYDAADLEKFARNRLIEKEKSASPSNLFYLLADMVSEDLERRKIDLREIDKK